METVVDFIGDRYPAFSVQFWPKKRARANVVFLPPFAEEMNRCRSLVSSQARWFASAGLSCSILDFYGTGEGHGDLADACLHIWRTNTEDLINQVVRRNPAPVYLWGCRMGGLLALDYAACHPGVIKKLLLWQPLTSGSTFVNQMLRQRTASLMQKGQPAESLAQMKSRITAGEPLEVAGYRLGGRLLEDMSGLEAGSAFPNGMFDQLPEIIWMEHAPIGDSAPSAKNEKAVAQLRESGVPVNHVAFSGDPVWRLQKRGSCNDLLEKTRRLQL